MITKQDILDRASEWRLRPDVVEKDYVLGWLLAGLAQHAVVRDYWVFKGGTCIKKCYFETYRFSEDLDFSLLPAAPYTAAALRQVLLEVASTTTELSGILFPPEAIEVKERKNKQGQLTFQGKLAYGGPLRQLNTSTPPRVLFDITKHEALVDESSDRAIFHPYPDSLPDGAGIACYSLNELLAEKTRALYERTRPRDLYDVVYILDNPSGILQLDSVHEIFRRKCEFKTLPVPTADHLVSKARADEELKSEWANMLAHQLQDLPALEALLDRLTGLLTWIETPLAVLPGSSLQPAPVHVGESTVIRPGIQYWGSGLPLETIRFAGANRLLVEFSYHGKHRLAEPYSLRLAATGNLLFYAWELASHQIKAFKVAEMSAVKPSATAFTPRYSIELTSVGQPMARTAPSTSALPRAYPATVGRAQSSPKRRSSGFAANTGPTYVFRCPYCQKEFKHSKNDPALRKHKTDGGWQCSGQRGYLERVDY